jgi:hypothetical protein
LHLADSFGGGEAGVSVQRLVKEIEKLSPRERRELIRRILPAEKRGRREAGDPLADIIGIFEGPGTGSQRYKEDLYGKDRSP